MGGVSTAARRACLSMLELRTAVLLQLGTRGKLAESRDGRLRAVVEATCMFRPRLTAGLAASRLRFWWVIGWATNKSDHIHCSGDRPTGRPQLWSWAPSMWFAAAVWCHTNLMVVTNTRVCRSDVLRAP